jgi:hypothetical protein
MKCLTNHSSGVTPEEMRNAKRGENLTERVAFRATPHEYVQWRAAADAAELTFSAWAAEVLNEAVDDSEES